MATLGLLFLIGFFGLMIATSVASRKYPWRALRPIPAFSRLGKAIGLAVEAGQRLHISLGSSGVNGIEGASALVGLTMLKRITRVASISDRPPITTSGEAVLTVLSQDTLRDSYRVVGAEHMYDPNAGQLTGLTPYSYAAGTLPVIMDQQVSANVLAGHFGGEVALITDAAERKGNLTLAGSDNVAAQAVLYATAQEPLIGEELYASGAYMQAGPMHLASLRTQDIMRWVLVGMILIGAFMKFVGVL